MRSDAHEIPPISQEELARQALEAGLPDDVGRDPK
jgi:hypothetical protein